MDLLDIIDAGNSSQTASAPSFGVMRAKQYRYYTANGYEYRDSKGHWHYVVTKSPFEAAFGVALHGWEGVLDGSWKSGHRKIRRYHLMSFFKNNTKRIPTEVKLLTDIQNALADAPTTEEKPFLLEAEQSLKSKKYLPKILSDLQFFLTPLAIKSALSPKVKVIYLNLISDKYQTSTTGSGIGMIFGGFSGFGGR